VKDESKYVDFNIGSQNSISGAHIVSGNLQIGVPNSQLVIYANTKGFNPEELTIDTGDTNLE
jgi:hypothetical protein